MWPKSPEMAWRCLCPKCRSRGQDHSHPNAHLSPRTTRLEWCELSSVGPHSWPVFGECWGDAHHKKTLSLQTGDLAALGEAPAG